MAWKIIGLTAAALTMFSFVPQIVKAYKTKSVKDMSPITLVQLSCGVTLWIIYGIYLQDAIIITANSVTLFSLILLLFMYYGWKGASS